MVSEYSKKEWSHIAVVVLGEFGHYLSKIVLFRRREEISDLNLNEISNTYNIFFPLKKEIPTYVVDT